jgi:hypothetical protein
MRYVEPGELWQDVATFFEMAVHPEVEGVLTFGESAHYVPQIMPHSAVETDV